ncbi:MAG: nucleoid-associated protein, YbaB/EbfC family, partial [Helicobacteraceae bacterium]|nr:nucleoid-associated protein, YbaB/EbfC family [Helicobacteraceae bacterium]
MIDITIDDSLLSDKDAMQILLISAANDAFKMLEED